jgi:putative acetyltransferase
MIRVRLEEAEDIPRVRTINEDAFGQPVEADLVDELRRSCPETLSLVAEKDGLLVGHIMFSPSIIFDRHRRIPGMALGPMAVQPASQCQGIGSKLVGRGLEILKDRGCPFVVVLGHPSYYPRFGFEPASKHNVKCQWEGIPDEAFMILAFDQNALKDSSGVAMYRDEFNDAMQV